MSNSQIPIQTKEQSEISIINSIADANISISNMINMEIDKIKLATTSIPNNPNSSLATTTAELIAINTSIKNLLNSICCLDKSLNQKLKSAVNNSN